MACRGGPDAAARNLRADPTAEKGRLRRAERAMSGSISFHNILATSYRVLGIDAAITLPDFNGRPHYLLNDREPIQAFLG